MWGCSIYFVLHQHKVQHRECELPGLALIVMTELFFLYVELRETEHPHLRRSMWYGLSKTKDFHRVIFLSSLHTAATEDAVGHRSWRTAKNVLCKKAMLTLIFVKWSHLSGSLLNIFHYLSERSSSSNCTFSFSCLGCDWHFYSSQKGDWSKSPADFWGSHKKKDQCRGPILCCN